MILLRIPVTKRVSTGTAAVNTQKGDTCWYYVSRLVREYHGMTYSWRPSTDITGATAQARQVERSISAVRKFETELGEYMEDKIKLWPKKPTPVQIEGLYGLLRRSGADSHVPKEQFREFVDKNYAGNVTNYAQAHDKLYDYVKTWNTYASIGTSTISGVWGKYGFLFHKADDLTALGLALVIARHGPLVVAGSFLDANNAIDGANTISFAGKVEVAQVTDFGDGQHALAVCGVALTSESDATPLVFYHDPNEPTVLAATSFASFKAQLDTGVGLGYLPCGATPCSHRVDIPLM